MRLREGLISRTQSTGVYHITGKLPPRGDSPQYRVRSDDEPYERVVTQDQFEIAPPSGEAGANLLDRTFTPPEIVGIAIKPPGAAKTRQRSIPKVLAPTDEARQAAVVVVDDALLKLHEPQ